MTQRFLLLLCLLGITSAYSQTPEWQTYYEKSGYIETPRYQQTIEYCTRLASGSPMIHYADFGTSPQGRPLPLLILDKDGLTDPVAIHATGRTVLLLQACIHAGESEGKDAGLMLVRDLAIQDTGYGIRDTGYRMQNNRARILDHVSIMFIPIFNVDGHERFGPNNRINQNGPKEMGWRTTASNLNLNRDYLKADAPEMQAWLRMFSHWMPDFFIDTHTTDGADYQYVLTYQMDTFGEMDEGLTAWTRETFLPQLKDRMYRDGYPVFPYVEFRNWHDPRSGLVSRAAPPMLSQGYTSRRNRPGLLIETHMLKPYRQRVEATYACILTTLEILSRESVSLNGKVRRADEFCSSETFLKEPFTLQFETKMKDSVMVEFLGVEYTSVKSRITGGDWFSYSSTPATFQIPFFSSAKPSVMARLPYAYIIPAEWTTVTERLKLHGIRVTELRENAMVRISACKFRNPKWQVNPFEGRHPLVNIEYDETEETRQFPAGSVLVETMQPAGRIIPQILEPRGDGSYVFWGFFDAVFEQKEYGESYVIEKMAPGMLVSDPALKKEFDQKMATDSIFARTPQLILNWFYNRSPYADTRKGVYPIGRIFDPAVVEQLKH